MKKHILLLFTFVFMMLFSVTTVDAKTITISSQIVTLYPSKETVYDYSQGKYVSKNESRCNFYDEDLYPKTIKSSNTSVAVPGKKVKAYRGTENYQKVKKVGTTTISGKYETTTYKYKLNVKKYTNPFSSIKINGKNITSKFQTKSVYVLPYENEKMKLTFKSKKDWRIGATFFVAQPEYLYIRPFVSGQSRVVHKKKSTFSFTAVNDKTGQRETCEIIWK